MAGAATNIANWLSEIFLTVYNSGVLVPTEQALNFNAPLTAIDNPGSGWIDISITPPITANVTSTAGVTTASGGTNACYIPFDANAGALKISFPATTVDGYLVHALDAGRVTSGTNTVTFTDSTNGYQIQDPDTMSLALWYTASSVRNFSWQRVTCTRTSTTFWAAI